MPDLRTLACAFALKGRVQDIRPYGQGIINDTFLLTCAGGPVRQAILQRINRRVFAHPERILRNMRILQEHVGPRQAALPTGERRLRLPQIIPTRDGQDWLLDEQGGLWRALSFIGPSRTLQRISDLSQAREIGWALGRFHRLTSDLDPARLSQSLPGFHVTPRYLQRFDQVIKRPRAPSEPPALERALSWVEAYRHLAPVLEQARRTGQLPLRTTHGDPKLSNLLFDPQGTRVMGLIDLDTIQAGLIHYDLGDCLRSCCNTASEEDPRPRFDPAICRALLGGYLSEAQEFLDAREYPFLYPAILLLPFELGLRFLTDHLEGDRYFKVDAHGQNLKRALTQFRLVESIASEGERIRRMLSEFASE